MATMSEVTLSAAARTALLSQSRTTLRINLTNSRISTGLRVRQAVDDAPAFFQAKSLSNRASELLNVKRDIGQSLSAVDGALAGIDAAIDISRQLRGIALAARGGSAAERLAAAAQFDSLRVQLGNLAGDVSFGGVNLLAASPDTLNVKLNETGSASVSIAGSPADAAGLGIGAAAVDFNSFASDADINAAISGLDGAISSLRSQAAGFGSNVALLNIREQFTQDLGTTLQAGADKLINANLTAEAATLLSLQVRDRLGNIALGIANQNGAFIADII